MTERHADSERIDVYIAEIRAREMRVCVSMSIQQRPMSRHLVQAGGRGYRLRSSK